MKRPPSVKTLQAQCDAWNTAHAVGTRVRYFSTVDEKGNPEGDGIVRRTKTIAEVFFRYSAGVWLTDFNECVVLGHLRAEPLTPQQLALVRHIAVGLNNQEAAAAMTLKPQTVKNYLVEIFSELKLRDRAQLMLWAQRNLRAA